MATLGSYSIVLFLVQVTIKSTSLAANMVGDASSDPSARLPSIMLALWAALCVTAVVAQVLQAATNRKVYSAVFLATLASVFSVMIVIIARFLFQVRFFSTILRTLNQFIFSQLIFTTQLQNAFPVYQLWNHLTRIDEASGSSSVRSSIVAKIRPFMIFMIALSIGAAAASLVQVLAVIALISADAAPSNSDPSNPDTPEYFSAARYANFDLFAPVTVFVYSCAIYYAWKPRPGVDAALSTPLAPKSLRSARQTALISSVETSPSSPASSHGGDGANDDSIAAAAIESVWLEQTAFAGADSKSRHDGETDAPVQVVGKL